MGRDAQPRCFQKNTPQFERIVITFRIAWKFFEHLRLEQKLAECRADISRFKATDKISDEEVSQ